jgi:hypothetical protein
MGLDDPVHNRQPQSAIASFGTHPRCIDLVEPVKEIRPMFWGNADSFQISVTECIQRTSNSDKVHRFSYFSKGDDPCQLHMIERAQDNLRRFKAKQPLVGHLLPYLTGEEAKQQGWHFHEEHGWIEAP